MACLNPFVKVFIYIYVCVSVDSRNRDKLKMLIQLSNLKKVCIEIFFISRIYCDIVIGQPSGFVAILFL